ncbi:hypothetical protein [Brachyspira sp.]|uniref:hypothetical protein n=1 Tax=Brachyspira sp. TaxID=1977261 RepID=UPI00263A37E9|nr:hypothetical protein [Brachyspira sp.]
MKKLIILLLIIYALFIGCSNNTTKPKTFKVGDLVGRWENNANNSDYFLITSEGYMKIGSNQIKINNWYQWEEVTEVKLTAQMTNDHFITFYFDSVSSCTLSSTGTSEKIYFTKK